MQSEYFFWLSKLGCGDAESYQQSVIRQNSSRAGRKGGQKVGCLSLGVNV